MVLRAEKLAVVKEIIVGLARDLDRLHDSRSDKFQWTSLPIDQFLRKDQLNSSVSCHLIEATCVVHVTSRSGHIVAGTPFYSRYPSRTMSTFRPTIA